MACEVYQPAGATQARTRRSSWSTICPGRLGSGSEDPRGRQAVPDDSDPGPRACVFDQLSRANCTCVLGYAGSTSCPGRLGTGYECPRGRPAVPGDLGPGPRARWVDQVSWAMRVRVRGPVGSICGHPDPSPDPKTLRVNQLLGKSRARLLRARVVDQQSRATHTYVLEFVGSTSCPGRLGPGPKSPWGRLAVPGDSDPGPRSCGVDRLSRGTQDRGDGQRGPPVVPGESRPVLKPAGSTSSPWRLALGTECPGGRPVFPGDSGHCPRAQGVDQLSRVTRA